MNCLGIQLYKWKVTASLAKMQIPPSIFSTQANVILGLVTELVIFPLPN